jgi:hypothetical protein
MKSLPHLSYVQKYLHSLFTLLSYFCLMPKKFELSECCTSSLSLSNRGAVNGMDFNGSTTLVAIFQGLVSLGLVPLIFTFHKMIVRRLSRKKGKVIAIMIKTAVMHPYLHFERLLDVLLYKNIK